MQHLREKYFIPFTKINSIILCPYKYIYIHFFFQKNKQLTWNLRMDFLATRRLSVRKSLTSSPNVPGPRTEIEKKAKCLKCYFNMEMFSEIPDSSKVFSIQRMRPSPRWTSSLTSWDSGRAAAASLLSGPSSGSRHGGCHPLPRRIRSYPPDSWTWWRQRPMPWMWQSYLLVCVGFLGLWKRLRPNLRQRWKTPRWQFRPRRRKKGSPDEGDCPCPVYRHWETGMMQDLNLTKIKKLRFNCSLPWLH